MPKDEFDPEDPMELVGVGLFTDEDTTDPMTECFIEEFMRMGYNHKQLLALFRNPHYTGMNMVLQNRGEQYVRDQISEVFARWGRPFAWPTHSPTCKCADPPPPDAQVPNVANPARACRDVDPMGEPAPDLKF